MTDKKKCNTNGCSLESHNELNECILHCQKSDYSSDFESNTLSKFFNSLISFIVDSYLDEEQIRGFGDKETLKTFFKGDSNVQTSINSQKVKALRIVFIGIQFPSRDSRDSFDYLKLLSKFGFIHFKLCTFQASSLNLEKIECFYESCHFNKEWYVSETKLLPNINSALYQECTFEKDLFSNPDDKRIYTLSVPLFYNCFFNGNIEFNNINFKMPVYISSDKNHGDFKYIEFNNCSFDFYFELNNTNKIEKLIISNSTFNEEFELKNNLSIGLVIISKSTFVKSANYFKSSIDILKFNDSVFDSTSIFDYCTVGIAKFGFVIFNNIANFRDANFKTGLDIENASFSTAPNFLNAHVSLKASKRETFRIIKNSFDKIGNNIEANKFYALELKKYREELNGVKNRKKERFVFFLNDLTSEFGQNYWKPIWLMLIVAFLYYLIILGYENNILYNFSLSTNNKISNVIEHINGFAKSFIPFQKILKEGVEFISLFFGFIFAGLTWQTIVAIKRYTRR